MAADLMNHDAYLVSCEHGGNRIPPDYRHLFRGLETLLQSHRGHDPGALAMARILAAALSAKLHFSTASRLLVDLNRSPGHPKLHSEAIRHTPAAVRRQIRERYYLPYREAIEADIAALVAQGRRVVHIASHSFTPVLEGEVRQADIGLLYDPARAGERALCLRWQESLGRRLPGFRVRRNYPYTGKSDGLTAFLRRRFPAAAYLGIELEINQRHVFARGRRWRELRDAVPQALRQALMLPGQPG